jgi:hypothetical protein
MSVGAKSIGSPGSAAMLETSLALESSVTLENSVTLEVGMSLTLSVGAKHAEGV